jgi:hypothetical protein
MKQDARRYKTINIQRESENTYIYIAFFSNKTIMCFDDFFFNFQLTQNTVAEWMS